MNIAIDPVAEYILRILLSIIFFRAAFHKSKNRKIFAAELANYQLLPAFLVTPFSILIPFVEWLTAVTLLNIHLNQPPIVATILLLSYGAAMGINLKRGRTQLDCGCTGPLFSKESTKKTISKTLVLRNIILSFLALLCAGSTMEIRSFDWVDISTIIFGSLVMLALYEAFEQAISNQQRVKNYLANTPSHS